MLSSKGIPHVVLKSDIFLPNVDYGVPYRRYYNPGVQFFKMDFWVGFNSNLAKILPSFGLK